MPLKRELNITMKIHKILFPDRCVLCGRLTNEDEHEICSMCRENNKQLIKVAPKFPAIMFIDEQITAAWYEDEVRLAVHRFKFNQKPGYARAFAREIFKQYILERCHYDFLTYTPSNKMTVFKRGYNQAALLAKELSKYTGKPVIKTVKKVRRTKAMFKLKPEERRANVLNAYKLCCKPKVIKDKSVLIVDDIFTTGATVSEIAKVLKLGGAYKVGCATFAHKKV